MSTIEPLKIEGLRDLQASLKQMDGESQKQLRLVLNEAADIVVRVARPRVPVKTGKARATLKASSSQREARVQAGSSKVAYYGWLDFGGRVGRNKSVVRPFMREGRYVYASYYAQKENIGKLLAKRLTELVERAGLDVTEDGV